MPENYGDRPQKLKDIFMIFDKNKTGKVSAEVLIKLLTKFSSNAQTFTIDEVREFTTDAANGDATSDIEYNKLIDDIIFGEVKC